MKTLKKQHLAALVAMALGVGAVSEASAFSLVVGNQKWFLEGFSSFEDSSFTKIGIADGTSGNLWGVANVTSIAVDTDNNGTYETASWSSGDGGEYRNIRFGNIDLRFVADPAPGATDVFGQPLSGYAITGFAGLPMSPIVTPHNAYFGHDDGADNAIAGNLDGTTNGLAFAQVWATSGVNMYSADVLAGIGASNGDLGSFANGMATHATSELLLDLVFGAGGIYIDEALAGSTATGVSTTDIFRSVAGSTTQNSTLGYLDVVGGSQASAYDTDGYLGANAGLLAAVGRTTGFDIRIEASNSANPLTTPGLTPAVLAAGWDSAIESSSVTGKSVSVPEPGVLGLLGIGLLGLGVVYRKRKA